MANQRYQALPTAKRRRLIFGAALPSVLVATVLVVLYYVLPLDRLWDSDSAMRLLIGLLVFAGVMVWQIRTIAGSRYVRVPGSQARGHQGGDPALQRLADQPRAAAHGRRRPARRRVHDRYRPAAPAELSTLEPFLAAYGTNVTPPPTRRPASHRRDLSEPAREDRTDQIGPLCPCRNGDTIRAASAPS